MKKLIVVFLLIINSNTFSQSYPHLTDLRGIEDSLGNTHLFYRYVNPLTGCWSKNIYHFDLLNNIDTLFIPDFGYTDLFLVRVAKVTMLTTMNFSIMILQNIFIAVTIFG